MVIGICSIGLCHKRNRLRSGNVYLHRNRCLECDCILAPHFFSVHFHDEVDVAVSALLHADSGTCCEFRRIHAIHIECHFRRCVRSHAFFEWRLYSVHPHSKLQATGTQISHVRAVSALVHEPFHIADIDRIFDLKLDRICFLNSVHRCSGHSSSVIIVRVCLRHSHLCLLIRCNSCYFRQHKVFSVQQLIGILSPRRLES